MTEAIKNLENIILYKSEMLDEYTGVEEVEVLAELIRLSSILKKNEIETKKSGLLIKKVIENLDAVILKKVTALTGHTSTAEVAILAELVRVASILKKNAAVRMSK